MTDSQSNTPPYALSVEEALDRWEANPEQGLSSQEARRRLDEHGPNRLRRQDLRPWWLILLSQFKDAMAVLLGAAGVVAAVYGQWPEAIAIAAVIVVNVGIGFVSQWKARRSMEALRRVDKDPVTVLRDGERRQVDPEALVPGDVVVLEAECFVPADLRLVAAEGARVNEAALTGESVPVSKTVDAVEADTPLAERTSMAYLGSTLVEGSARGVAAATGMDTELGRITELAGKAESAAPPIRQRLDRLARRMAVIVLVLAALVAGGGLLAGRDTLLMIETAIALGVAAIPEGLPIVTTIALARGMYLMSRRNAIVKHIAAVETLGATRVIFTDKTGTLTENRMTVRRVATPVGDHRLQVDEGQLKQTDRLDDGDADDETAKRLMERAVRIGVLCNDARLADGEDEQQRGDPTEVALLAAGATLGMDRDEVIEELPETRQVDFDPDLMMMATYHDQDDGHMVAVKGAPESVLPACTRVASAEGDDELDDKRRDRWTDRAEALALEGLRVMAFAEKHVDGDDGQPYEALTFVGLIGLEDPPRTDVREAIDTCQAAGIRVEMVTGDKPETARAIAEATGITGDESDPETNVLLGAALEDPDTLSDQDREKVHHANIFARVSPEQKLNLVKIYQREGEVVAMTGDGVNDAPALKKADIGVAMGKRGTDAARQVADMVLVDDAFDSIVAAVRQGRVIFDNIRRSAMFMLCTNFAEVLAVAVASVTGLLLPLRPLQILYLNVLTDVFPALALGVGKGSDRVMERPPREPGEPILKAVHWWSIGGWSVLVSAVVLASLITASRWLGLSDAQSVTVSFMTLGFAKLVFVFNLREVDSTMFDNQIVRNGWVWASLALCSVLLLAAVYLPGLNGVLGTAGPSRAGWLTVAVMTAAVLAVGQVVLVGASLWVGKKVDTSDAVG